jgi:hypothetical protein
MKTLHLTPSPDDFEDQLARLNAELRERAGRGEHVAVTIAQEDELISPREAGIRLGFSRQHVMRLIEADELPARQMPGSSYWKLPLSGIVAFETRRDRARREADAFAAELDAAGAPAE